MKRIICASSKRQYPEIVKIMRHIFSDYKLNSTQEWNDGVEQLYRVGPFSFLVWVYAGDNVRVDEVGARLYKLAEHIEDKYNYWDQSVLDGVYSEVQNFLSKVELLEDTVIGMDLQ